MEPRKRSFFERLTGSVTMQDDEPEEIQPKGIQIQVDKKKGNTWIEEEVEEAELTVDVYQTPTEIVIQTMVAGVNPDNLNLTIARDTITINGKREDTRSIDSDNYFLKELYWGKFTRTISLPLEVEPEEAEATERHGLLTIKLKKVDKAKKNTVRIKSI